MNKVAIKVARQKLNLTQWGLAEMLGVSKSAVEKWEYGVNKISKPTQELLLLKVKEKDHVIKKRYRPNPGKAYP